MRPWTAAMVMVLGCSKTEAPPPAVASGSPAGSAAVDPWNAPRKELPSGGYILDARKGFQTKLVDDPNTGRAPPDKPPRTIKLVQYDAPVGKLSTYLAGLPTDGAQHPAMIWITGGDCNSIGDVWSPQDPRNDQTAAQYPKAGIVTMYPSLRGGNDNPGRREGFYGEVDDVLAAAEFLAKQPGVDPAQIYLGGHSTGGTLALLVAAAAPMGRFRAVIAFGPVASVDDYGVPNPYAPFDMSDDKELELRSPARWISTIVTPTFVFEGEHGNAPSLGVLRSRAGKAPFVELRVVDGEDHFSVLASHNAQLARLIAGSWRTDKVLRLR